MINRNETLVYETLLRFFLFLALKRIRDKKKYRLSSPTLNRQEEIHVFHWKTLIRSNWLAHRL